MRFPFFIHFSTLWGSLLWHVLLLLHFRPIGDTVLFSFIFFWSLAKAPPFNCSCFLVCVLKLGLRVFASFPSSVVDFLIFEPPTASAIFLFISEEGCRIFHLGEFRGLASALRFFPPFPAPCFCLFPRFFEVAPDRGETSCLRKCQASLL